MWNISNLKKVNVLKEIIRGYLIISCNKLGLCMHFLVKGRSDKTFYFLLKCFNYFLFSGLPTTGILSLKCPSNKDVNTERFQLSLQGNFVSRFYCFLKVCFKRDFWHAVYILLCILWTKSQWMKIKKHYTNHTHS